MQLAINLLTLVLVVVALFLGLLILVQLPKKEAGISGTFGSEFAAAHLGAGSGTALSNMTKWSVGIFLGLCFLIAILTASESQKRGILKLPDATVATAAAQAPSMLSTSTNRTATNVVVTPLGTNAMLPLAAKPATNAPAPAPATNAAGSKK